MRKFNGILLFFILMAGAAKAQDRFADVKIEASAVSGSVYMLTGAGGNIGVSAGEEGILMVDDQFAPLAERIAEALKGLADTDLRYIVNTHYHGDHTGSNEHFATHSHAVIMAHENVRKSISVKVGKGHESLPMVTYKDGVKIFLNDETIHVRHLPEGHTSGDSYIYFEKANVVHTGDLFFESRFPYVDIKGGGSVNGYIASVENILENTPDDVKIIPGHGALTNKEGYKKFLDMMKQTQSFVLERKKAGKTAKQIIEMKLPEQWRSWGWQFISEERWINTLYQ